MANSTIIYACTSGGLAIFNKPGTLPEWLPARVALAGQPVLSVWVDPGPPIMVVAVSGDGVLLSENGGRTWEPTAAEPGFGPGKRPTALFSSAEPATLFLATTGGGLAVSSDAGLAWKALPTFPSQGTMLSLAQSQRDPGRYFALVEQNAIGTLLAGSPARGDWVELPLKGVNAFAQDANSGNLYAATSEGLLRGREAGFTWEAIAGSPAGGQALLVLPAAEGKPPALLLAASGSLQISSDGGVNWQAVQFAGADIVSALAHDPERRDRVYAATLAGYVFESGNRGQSWQPVNSNPTLGISSLFVVRI